MFDNKILLLDGDELREVFGVNSINVENYGRDKRIALAMQHAYLCNVLAKPGFTVFTAPIVIFEKFYAWNRSNSPRYFDAYLRIPLEELRRRGLKGIYRCFDPGEIKDAA